MAEQKKEKVQSLFPSEIVDLPSGGSIYPKESPLSSGKIELKYMTTKEEDILTSQNLIKKGIVVDRLLDSLILTPGVKCDDLIVGDKNGVLVAARILAYGADYPCEVTDPSTGEKFQHNFNLADCDFKELPEDIDYSQNKFSYELPIGKKTIEFKILTGVEEKLVDRDLKGLKKMGQERELSTRLKYMITAVDGDDKKSTVHTFVENMLARDSLEFRAYLDKMQPDIILTQDVDMGGELVPVDIPLGLEFFWPKAGTQG
tara:strand:- start:1397 stop:2173 length:777 start_codon:yes stop_codon:yes gene_type:complete